MVAECRETTGYGFSHTILGYYMGWMDAASDASG